MVDQDPLEQRVRARSLSREISEQETRKLHARRADANGVWSGLGVLGRIGWSVTVPTLVGALLGATIDKHKPGAHSWTLALLLAGPGYRLHERMELGFKRKRRHPRRRARERPMSHIVSAVLTLVAGALLGACFFGGLWLTVRLCLPSTHGAALFAASFIARCAVVLGGFFLASSEGWRGLALCACGFLLARQIVVHSTRAAGQVIRAP